MKITAAVVPVRSAPFEIETLDLAVPLADEVLVRVVASGMCQTDLHARDGYFAMPYPGVYGHEGAGVVAAVGTAVKKVVPGDHVIVSFPWCGTCPNCRRTCLAPNLPIAKSLVRLNAIAPACPKVFQSPRARCTAAVGL